MAQKNTNNRPKGGPGGKMRFEKPKNPAKTLGRLFSYVVKNKALLFLVVLLVILSSVAVAVTIGSLADNVEVFMK